MKKRTGRKSEIISVAPSRPGRRGSDRVRGGQIPRSTQSTGRSSLRGGSPLGRGLGVLARRDVTPEGRVVVGLHACAEVLRVRPQAVVEIWSKTPTGPMQLQEELAQAVKNYKIPQKVLAEAVMDRVARGHQGLILFVNQAPELDWDSLTQQKRVLVLVLDGIEDPQNFGAILRSAWLMDVSAVLIPKDRAVGLTAATCKVASGGVEHVPVVTCNSLQEPLKRLKDLGFWVFGLAEKGSQQLWQLDLPEKVVWIVGAEDRGIRSSVERLCDELVRLPQVESGSSYNASVATSLATFETLRQWHLKN